jgi:hypothetical protein
MYVCVKVTMATLSSYDCLIFSSSDLSSRQPTIVEVSAKMIHLVPSCLCGYQSQHLEIICNLSLLCGVLIICVLGVFC